MNASGLLIAVLMVAVFGVGFVVGRSTSGMEFDSVVSTGERNTGSTAAAGEGIRVDSSSLSQGQRAMLRAFGIDPDNVRITPAMIACAEAKIGSSRATEIKNGATPTMAEGASLMACYSAS